MTKLSFIEKNKFENMLFDGQIAMTDPVKAQELKLIDRTQHYDDFLESIGAEEKHLVNINDYLPEEKYSFSDSKKPNMFSVAVIATSFSNLS